MQILNDTDYKEIRVEVIEEIQIDYGHIYWTTIALETNSNYSCAISITFGLIFL